MSSKIYFQLFFLILFSFNIKSQIRFKSYLNDSIKYDLVLSRVNGDDRNFLSELVLKTNVPDSIKDVFFKMPNAKVILFLKDSSTSWAMNLLLYEKFRKEPILYQDRIKNRAQWDLHLKNIDISNWLELLSIKKKTTKHKKIISARRKLRPVDGG